MNKKAFFFCFTAVCIAAMITAGCKNSTSGDNFVSGIPVTGVTVTPATAIVAFEETVTLTGTVEPANANQTLNWGSSNNAIATVDDNGVVTGVKAGKATITATSAANPAQKAACEVEVAPVVKKWTFGTVPDGWVATVGSASTVTNDTEVDYGRGMTLTASPLVTIGIRINPNLPAYGSFNSCIQPSGQPNSTGMFLTIADVPNSFTLTVKYSHTGSTAPSDARTIQARVGSATTAGDPAVPTSTNSADEPSVLIWDYTGPGGTLELYTVNGGLRIYEVTITTGLGVSGEQLEIPHTWEFRTLPTGWIADQVSGANNTNVDYGYGMTLTGASLGSRFYPTQTRPDGLIGYLQPNNEGGPFLTIADVPDSFTLTVKYTATGNAANTNYVQAVVDGAGWASKGGPECVASTALTPSVLTWDYTGAGGTLELWAYGGALRVYEVAIKPTVIPQSVEFTAPTGITGSSGNYTYNHSIAGGNTTLALSAKILPSDASQNISWEISGTGASLSTYTGTDVTATFDNTGTVTVTARAMETTTSATLTINVTDQPIPVSNITIGAPGTTVMAGPADRPRTYLFSAVVNPPSASDNTITWWVSDNSSMNPNSGDIDYIHTGEFITDEETGVTTEVILEEIVGKKANGGSIGDDGLLTVNSNVTVNTPMWVFAVAENSGTPVRPVPPGMQITVTPYNKLIWEYTASAANELINNNNGQLLVGKTALKGGGRYRADERGIQMQSQTRWTLGVPSTANFSGGGSATTITSYLTNGELDLRDKFRVTVSFAAPGTPLDDFVSNGAGVVSVGDADFTVQVQNNTTGSGASVFGNTINQVQKTPMDAGDLVFEFDPVNFNFTTQALAAGINDKDTVLSRAFIYFRSTSYAVITGIKIEYID